MTSLLKLGDYVERSLGPLAPATAIGWQRDATA
jgi:hypothetical protein